MLRLRYREACDYLRLVREHDDADRRFYASVHGVRLQEPDGRVHGMREGVLARMKQRQRQQHRRG